nr:unnamed protein product [Digitaria exilis]
MAREALQELALGPGLVDDAEAGVDGGADVLIPERGGGGRAEAGEERLQHPHEHGLLGGGLGPGFEAAAGNGASAAWSAPSAWEVRPWWGSSAMGSMPPAPSVLGRPIPAGHGRVGWARAASG